jgi:hypothetical protein
MIAIVAAGKRGAGCRLSGECQRRQRIVFMDTFDVNSRDE